LGGPISDRKWGRRTLAPFLNLIYDMYLHYLISSGDDQNGADDVDGGARGPHFLKFETRLRHVAPRFAIVTWGRRCRVCPDRSATINSSSSSCLWQVISSSDTDLSDDVDILRPLGTKGPHCCIAQPMRKVDSTCKSCSCPSSTPLKKDAAQPPQVRHVECSIGPWFLLRR